MTILRDPVDTFESFYSYMNIDQRLELDINQFAVSLLTRQQENNMSQDVTRGRNKALYDLGLDPAEMSEQEKVLSKIRSLEEEFDQVLILERLEESLVLMAGSLCWRLEQVSHVRLNSRKEDFVTSLSPESRDILAGWLWADRLLYEHFLGSHSQEVDTFGASRMKNAVELLRGLNERLRSECVSEVKENVEKVFQQNNGKIQQIVPSQERAWCRDYFKTEISFTKSLRAMNRKHLRLTPIEIN